MHLSWVLSAGVISFHLESVQIQPPQDVVTAGFEGERKLEDETAAQ